MDPLQFAYRANRSVDDAVNMALYFTLQHLDSPGTYARILFVFFSSAFNTIIPALLQDKLSQITVPDSICRWITDFLSDRKQHVLGKMSLTPRPSAFLVCVKTYLAIHLILILTRVIETWRLNYLAT